MPTFHTLAEALKEFERLSKIDSIDDGFIRWSTSEGDKILHLPPMLDFLSLVWQSAQESQKEEIEAAFLNQKANAHDQAVREQVEKEIRSNIGMLRQWLNERNDKLMVTNEAIETFLFPITNPKENK